MAADPIDERYDEIVRHLRALPGAPEELRARVLDLGTAADVRRPRRRGLTLAVAVGLLVVAAVAGIVLGGSGGSSSKTSYARAEREAGVTATPSKTLTSVRLAPRARDTVHGAFQESAAGGRGVVALPVSPTRLTDVHASMRLRVSSLDGLSKATSKAMRITRRLGGFVQSVDYGTPSSSCPSPNRQS